MVGELRKFGLEDLLDLWMSHRGKNIYELTEPLSYTFHTPTTIAMKKGKAELPPSLAIILPYPVSNFLSGFFQLCFDKRTYITPRSIPMPVIKDREGLLLVVVVSLLNVSDLVILAYLTFHLLFNSWFTQRPCTPPTLNSKLRYIEV